MPEQNNTEKKPLFKDEDEAHFKKEFVKRMRGQAWEKLAEASYTRKLFEGIEGMIHENFGLLKKVEEELSTIGKLTHGKERSDREKTLKDHKSAYEREIARLNGILGQTGQKGQRLEGDFQYFNSLAAYSELFSYRDYEKRLNEEADKTAQAVKDAEAEKAKKE